MSTLLRPPPLRPGDQVGVLAPASPCPKSEMEAGCTVLSKLGLKLIREEDPGDFQPHYLAGDDRNRADRFNEFLQHPEIKALFCVRGGYGSFRILPRLSYEQMRLTPKAIIGFSDITALLLACLSKAGVVCFHGPTVSTLGNSDSASVESLWTALSSPDPVALHFPEALCLRPGTAEGMVLGGNLTTLSHLLGTGFLPSLAGCILFLEDRGESMYRIDRMLTQLMYSNVFDEVEGLILGDFTETGPRSELNQLVQERLALTSFPILSGVPVGHQQRNLTLPVGPSATLDAVAATLTYHQSAVAP